MIRQSLLLLILFATFPGWVSSEGIQVSVGPLLTECVMGCFDALTLLSFSDIPSTAGYYDGYCLSEQFTTSLVYCARTYCTTKQIEPGWEKLNGYCVEYGEVDLDTYKNVEQELNVQIEVGNVTTINSLEELGTMVNGTVLVDLSSFTAGYRTENVWDREMTFHHAFGWSMYTLLGCTLLVGIFNRLYCTYNISQMQSGHQQDRSEMTLRESRYERWYSLYRRYIGSPALFGLNHSTGGRWYSLPTRLQAIFIFIYVSINIIFCFMGYTAFETNLYWPDDKANQIQRYIADRTAIMTFYNLPLLWCLAGRNDLILWLTGWSFASLNIFHRWVARITVLQAIVHSTLWTWMEREYLPREFEDLYWKAGVCATITMSLLLPFSIKPIRERWYEIFLITHIILALITLVMLFYHVTIYDGQYNPWLWACVSVWCLDRFLRIIRVVLLSWNAIKGNNATAIATGGKSGLVRLSVTTPFGISPKAGEYYYLYSPRSITPWENHPFTVASWSPSDKGYKLDFLIDTKKGATRRLRNLLSKANGTEVEMRILLEGPYGHTKHLQTFDRVLLVAGGSGITAILPHLYDLKQKRRKGGITRYISVLWVVNNHEYAKDVLSNELIEKDEIDGLEIEINVHVTGSTSISSNNVSSDVNSSSSSSTNSSPVLPELLRQGPAILNVPEQSELEKEKTRDTYSNANKEGSVKISSSRPNMNDVLHSESAKLFGMEKLGVLACGPPGMMDELRKVVSEAYGNDERQVRGSGLEYFEESFSW